MVWWSGLRLGHEFAATVNSSNEPIPYSFLISNRIVSQVLSSDTSELRKRAKAIEHDKESPSKEHLAALKDYGEKSMQEKQSIRDFSGNFIMSAVSRLY